MKFLRTDLELKLFPFPWFVYMILLGMIFRDLLVDEFNLCELS